MGIKNLIRNLGNTANITPCKRQYIISLNFYCGIKLENKLQIAISSHIRRQFI